jgi:ubiquinone/menaquinone biosynthesis C-methylase UbiE
VLDVGGGDSRLVDVLLDRSLTCVSVLDISQEALDRAKQRLGDRQASVTWIASDVTDDWSAPLVDIWHDRAVFHFLTDTVDRERYRRHLQRILRPGGSLVIATFGPEGPEKCSGLPVRRYSPSALEAELGSPFRLDESIKEIHTTPFGTTQEFWYSRLTLM